MTIMIGLRLHAFPAPLESDECNYAYFAERMSHGDRLYVDLWDHQPPGIYWLLMLPTAMFGSEPFVYRMVAMICVGVTLVFLWDLARRWWGSQAAVWVAVLFALCSSDPGMAGEGCNREIHMNVLIVAALWFVSRRAPTPSTVLASGALLGFASLIKPVVAIPWFAFVIPLFLEHRHLPDKLADKDSNLKNPNSSSRFTLHAILFALGPILIWAGTFIYFVVTGRAQVFMDAIVKFNLSYGDTGVGLWGRFLKFCSSPSVFSSAIWLWAAGCIGLIVMILHLIRFPQQRMTARPNSANRSEYWVMAATIGSYAAVCLPGQFWNHYYLLMLPCLVLLCGWLIHHLSQWRRTIGWVTVGVLMVGLAWTQTTHYLLLKPDQISRLRYGSRMTWVRDQARKVGSVTDPTDPIYVWSTDAGFYYYSERRCTTRFTMNRPLLSHDKTAANPYESEFLNDLEQNKPRLILLPAPPSKVLRQFIETHGYIPVGTDGERMLVLCDPNRPIETIDWNWSPPPE